MFRAMKKNEDWKYSQGNKPKSNVTLRKTNQNAELNLRERENAI